MTSYTLTVQEDKDTGELFIIFPEDVIENLGWTENDELTWTELPDGKWSLAKSE